MIGPPAGPSAKHEAPSGGKAAAETGGQPMQVDDNVDPPKDTAAGALASAVSEESNTDQRETYKQSMPGHEIRVQVLQEGAATQAGQGDHSVSERNVVGSHASPIPSDRKSQRDEVEDDNYVEDEYEAVFGYTLIELEVRLFMYTFLSALFMIADCFLELEVKRMRSDACLILATSCWPVLI